MLAMAAIITLPQPLLLQFNLLDRKKAEYVAEYAARQEEMATKYTTMMPEEKLAEIKAKIAIMASAKKIYNELKFLNTYPKPDSIAHPIPLGILEQLTNVS